MITRIVRMEFRPEEIPAFEEIFESSKQAIRAFAGCQHLELHRDLKQDNVRYTFSIWRSEDDLEAYRKSPVFADVWPRTKALFAAKPRAYSLVKLQEVSST